MDAAVPVDANSRAHRDLQNRADRGFTQRPQPSSTRENKNLEQLETRPVPRPLFKFARSQVNANIYDLDRARVLWVGRGKGRETIDRFFTECLSTGQKARITWASCDMSPTYTGAIREHCPNATLVIDRFHVVKALNEAVDEVRTEQWRALDAQGRKAIKGLRWLLSMHSSHRTKGHTRFLNSLRTSNRRIHRAWLLKDEFEHIWTYRYRGAAEKFLKRWMTAARRSRIPTLRRFAGTLRDHFENIVAFVDRPLTNAVGEGLNRIITIVKNRASGYRHLDYFADMIYLTVGDLDIPAQIPSELRTL